MLQIFIVGILHGFSFAPFNNVFAAILSVILFFRVIKKCENKKQILKNTLIFGCTYYIFSLHWVVNSLLIDVKKWWFVIPFAITLIPLILSLYYLVVTIPFFYFRKKIYGFAIFSALWIFAEFLKSNLFTGFPWNIFGSIWLDYEFGIFLLKKTNVYFVGFITIFLSLLTYELMMRKKYFVSLGLVVIIASFFIFYKNNNPAQESKTSDLKIRLVQPSIKQKFSWKYEELEEIFEKLIDISFIKNNSENFDLIVWPETAFPFLIDADDAENHDHLQYLASFLKENQFLVTGVMRSDEKDNYYNSMIVLNSKGDIVDFYDKKHLVPFGEYIPFKEWIAIDSITNLGSLTPGDKNKFFVKIKENIEFFPLICYEGIFPFQNDKIIDFAINLTNDGWFGDSFGPHQHLRAVRLQAIKFKRTVFRVANNGITAIIDENGKIVKRIDLNVDGVLDY
jgi:apolipoprotein N-acyltransferase